MLGSWMFIVFSPVRGVSVKLGDESAPSADNGRRIARSTSRGNGGGWHEKLSCPFAGMTRIRFKGFPRYDVAGVSARLTGAPLGTATNVGSPVPVSTQCHTGARPAVRLQLQ